MKKSELKQLIKEEVGNHSELVTNIWKQTLKKFNVKSLKDLPEDQKDAALEYMDSLAQGIIDSSEEDDDWRFLNYL
jgi:hypothetical protein